VTEGRRDTSAFDKVREGRFVVAAVILTAQVCDIIPDKTDGDWLLCLPYGYLTCSLGRARCS